MKVCNRSAGGFCCVHYPAHRYRFLRQTSARSLRAEARGTGPVCKNSRSALPPPWTLKNSSPASSTRLRSRSDVSRSIYICVIPSTPNSSWPAFAAAPFTALAIASNGAPEWLATLPPPAKCTTPPTSLATLTTWPANPIFAPKSLSHCSARVIWSEFSPHPTASLTLSAPINFGSYKDCALISLSPCTTPAVLAMNATSASA